MIDSLTNGLTFYSLNALPIRPKIGDVCFLSESCLLKVYDGTRWCELPSVSEAEAIIKGPYPMLEGDYDRAMEMVTEMGVEFT